MFPTMSSVPQCLPTATNLVLPETFWLCRNTCVFLPLPFYMYLYNTLDPLFQCLAFSPIVIFCTSFQDVCFFHCMDIPYFDGYICCLQFLGLQKLLKLINDIRDIFTMECSNKISLSFEWNGLVYQVQWLSSWTPMNTDKFWPPPFFLTLPPPHPAPVRFHVYHYPASGAQRSLLAFSLFI